MATHDTTATRRHTRPRSQRGRARWLRWAGLGIGLLAVALGLRGWAIARSAGNLMAELRALEALARDPRRLLADGEGRLAIARARLAALRADLGPLPAIAGGLGWVPGYGADLVAAAPLLDAAGHTLAAAESLYRAGAPLAPALRNLSRESLGDPALARQLAAARPAFELARQEAARAEHAWAGIVVEQLSPALQDRVAQARPLAPLMSGIAGLGVASIDTYAALSPLLPYAAHLEQLEQLLAPHSPLAADMARLTSALPAARASVAQASQDWARVPLDELPAGQRRQVAQLAALPDLYLALIDTAEAASAASAALAPVLAARDPALPLGTAITRGLSVRGEQIAAARALLERAAHAWKAESLAQLPPALSNELARVPERIAAARDGLDLAAALPDLLGASGRRGYLLLAQSGDELRATGGFITSAGLLSLADGRVVGLELEDSGMIDAATINGPRPYAPEAMGRYMKIYRWVFRDANWSPDFPTAARMASQLYALSGRPTSADVIALDITAMQELLRALGPVTLPGEPAPIDAGNVIAYFERQYNRHGSNNEVSIGPLTQALLARLEAGDVDILPLIKIGRQLLERRHLLIAAGDPAEAALFARLGWDGAVRPGEHDFLMVVDANVGYTKSSRSLRQELSYAVDLSDPTTPVATLTISYTHTAPPAAGCAPYDPRLPDYAAQTVECYAGYVRALAPGASYLLHAANPPSPAEWSRLGIADDGQVTSSPGEAGARVFGAYFAMPPGGRRAIVLRYSLPETVVTADGPAYRYRLRVQKQAGREPVPLRVSLRLPAGATVARASPRPAVQGGNVQSFALSLARDAELDIIFRLP